MYFDRDSKPELLCCKDGFRPSLTSVELTVDGKGGGFICATNGVSLIKLPVTDTGNDTPGPIPPEAFDRARKLARKAKTHVAEIQARAGVIRFADDSTMPRPERAEGCVFPDVDRVIPKREEANRLDSALLDAEESRGAGGNYVLTLGIDPELLANACKARGLTGVVAVEIQIEPPRDREGARVHAPLTIRKDGSILVVMPGRV